MPTIISNDHQTNTAPLPADPFWDQVVRGVRRLEARARLEEQLTGVPRRFSFSLRETSTLTGLPISRLRRLIYARQITARKIDGWWMVRRPQLLRLLPARRNAAALSIPISTPARDPASACS